MFYQQSAVAHTVIRIGFVVPAPPPPPHLQSQSIQWKELFTIYLACAVWGHHGLVGYYYLTLIIQLMSKAKDLIALACKIFLISAKYNFFVMFKHIPGSNNPIADALSCLQMQKFHQLAPDTHPIATPIPEHLLQL